MDNTDHTDLHSDDSPCQAAPAVGLISNPDSGRNRKQLQAIKEIIANHPGVHHQVTGSPDEVPAALTQLAQKSVGVVAINGGDGTVARVLTHLLQHSPFEKLPLVALLPGGTTNMNVGDVGLRGSLIRAVKRLCHWSGSQHDKCELLRRPILQVQPGGGLPAVCGMFFGTGAIIQGIDYCRRNIHSKGVGNEAGAGLVLARMIWGIVRRDRQYARPVTVSVALNSQPPGPAREELLLLVSGLERLLLGMRPYWGHENGPLHISMIRYDAEHFLQTFPSLLRGKPGRHATEAAGYRSHNVDRIRLDLDGTWTLDGEMYQATSANGPVIITNGGTVTFVRM